MNKRPLLTNHAIYELSKRMTFNALVIKVHQTQPGLDRRAIRRIVNGVAKLRVGAPDAAETERAR